jgi:hypothetical protein
LALLLGFASVVCLTVFGLLTAGLLVFFSVILLVACVYFAGYQSFSRFGMLKVVLLGALLAALVIESVALIAYNLPYALNLPADSGFALHWRLVELSLANSAYPLLPYAYLTFMLLGIAAFLWELAGSNWLSEKFTISPLGQLRAKVESLKQQEFTPKSAGFPIGLALLISFTFSVFFVVITQFPWINPTHRLIAVDAPSYYQWLSDMRGLDAGSALALALQNDRMLFVGCSYLLSFAFPKVAVIQFMPALLVPLFTLVSLYLLRLVCGFRESWIYVVLIAPFSIQALGLIYSGYFANMLAAVFVYLYFALMLKWKGGHVWSVLLLSCVSLLVLL